MLIRIPEDYTRLAGTVYGPVPVPGTPPGAGREPDPTSGAWTPAEASDPAAPRNRAGPAMVGCFGSPDLRITQ